MKIKYILIFSVAILFTAGLVLAEQPSTWTKGNFRYTKTPNGIKVEQINKPVQTENKNTPQVPNKQTSTQQQFLDVSSITPIEDINVAVGTDSTLLSLPEIVTAVMSNESTKHWPVLWDEGTPKFDASIAGTYTFSGTPVLSGKFTNTKSIKAVVNVVVGAETSTPQEETIAPPAPEEITTPQEETPAPEQTPASDNIIQNAGASISGAIGGIFNFIFAPFKVLFKIK